MSSEVGANDPARIREVIAPALQHLIRLDSYFRLHDIQSVSVHLEAALNELERLTVRDDAPLGDSDDALVEADQGQRLYTAG